jgi:hypothetical protein
LLLVSPSQVYKILFSFGFEDQLVGKNTFLFGFKGKKIKAQFCSIKRPGTTLSTPNCPNSLCMCFSEKKEQEIRDGFHFSRC